MSQQRHDHVVFWLHTRPSPAPVGGVIEAAAVEAGFRAIKTSSVLSKVIIAAVLSRFMAGLVAVLTTFIAYRTSKPAETSPTKRDFRCRRRRRGVVSS
jgi:PiT family inorganic phosphate transporter